MWSYHFVLTKFIEGYLVLINNYLKARRAQEHDKVVTSVVLWQVASGSDQFAMVFDSEI